MLHQQRRARSSALTGAPVEIESEARIQHRPERVFAAYRDHMSEVCVFIPDVREIIVQAREPDGALTRVRCEWVSDRDVPAFALSFLRPEHLRWLDDAVWDANALEARWQISPRAFTDAVLCSGVTRILADGDGSKVVLSGELRILVDEIPGVPKFLARRLAPMVEQFIVRLITPNLVETNRAIERFLDVHSEV